MTRRSFHILIGSFLGTAMIFSVGSIAFAATPEPDTTPPSDVERLTAVIGDSMITLSWDGAKDDVGVTGYKIYFGPDEVTETNTATYAKHETVENVTTYELKKLENGKKYYIAVTAVDASGNESENYSPYVAVKPMSKIVAATGGVDAATTTVVAKDSNDTKGAVVAAAAPAAGADTTAPTVKSAIALYKGQVKVTFSEQVKLPALKPEKAFTVQDNIVYEKLVVNKASMDPSDKTGTIVLLDTDNQNPDSDYIVTVSSDVEDIAGNPISSGTSDVGQFKGSSMTLEAYLKAHPAASSPAASAAAEKTPAAKPEDAVKNTPLVPTANAAASDSFKISKLEVQNDTTIKITFSKPLVLSINPTENFSVTKKNDPKALLSISSIEINEAKTSVIITATMEPKTDYTLVMSNVMNDKGDLLTKENSTFDFVSTAGAVVKKDTTPPEDVSSFVAKTAKTLAAKLSWTKSRNSAGDLIEYILYRSMDGKQYGQMTSLSKENIAYEAQELSPGYYYYKITAKDASGNESKGKSVKVHLAETGPEVGLLVLTSVGLGRVFGRKRKQKKSAA